MIDEGYSFCSSFVDMMKIILKRLSEKNIEMMNDYEIIKKLCDEHQLKSCMTVDFFHDLKIPNDANIRGEIISELRRSDFVSRQRCQILSTEAHKVNGNQKREYFKLKFEIT